MQINSALRNASNIGFLIIAAVALARLFWVLPMAQLMLLGAILHFLAGLLVLPRSSANSFKKAFFLSWPYFVAGTVLVFFKLSNIFYLIPLAAPVSAFCGFLVREKWQRSHVWVAAPAFILWAVVVGIAYHSITPKALSHDFDIDLNEAAPIFSAQMLDGQRITSEALSGKVTLIDFWGTWCAPCLQQFPELQEVYERFLNHPEVGILALNTGWSGDDPDKIKRFFDLHPYSFPVAHDDNSVSEDFGITSLPHLVLLDKMGKIRMRHTGLMREKGGLKAGLIQRIEELLQEEQDLNQ